MLITGTCKWTTVKSFEMKGPVFVWTNPNDVKCIRHQVGIITHIELPRYVK
jgi:hypothetical protein